MTDLEKRARELVSEIEQSLMQKDHGTADHAAKQALHTAYRDGARDVKGKIGADAMEVMLAGQMWTREEAEKLIRLIHTGTLPEAE